MSDYKQHLLSYLDPSKIMTLSCDHVIPPSNLLAIPIVQTLNGSDFEFTFENRNSEKMVRPQFLFADKPLNERFR
jgi:chromosome transmission fidelity protein 1